LFAAVEKGHEACVRVLIAAKANVTYTNSYYDWTALHGAVINDHASICRVLIDEGASLTAATSAGKTPLEVAKARGKAKCVAVLEAAVASSSAMGGAV